MDPEPLNREDRDPQPENVDPQPSTLAQATVAAKLEQFDGQRRGRGQEARPHPQPGRPETNVRQGFFCVDTYIDRKIDK